MHILVVVFGGDVQLPEAWGTTQDAPAAIICTPVFLSNTLKTQRFDEEKLLGGVRTLVIDEVIIFNCRCNERYD